MRGEARLRIARSRGRSATPTISWFWLWYNRGTQPGGAAAQPSLDQAVAQATRAFVERLSTLSTDRHEREAIVKSALRELAWAFLERFDYALVDHFDGTERVTRQNRDAPDK
jgi:hypothetical protein